MTRVLALARFESTLLLRNRTAAVTALAFPLALGVFFAMTQAEDANWPTILSLQLVSALGLSVYVSATTALTARRQDNTLKRLRAGETGDAEILAGLLGPLAALGVLQGVLMTVIAVVAGAPWPERPHGIALAILAGTATGLAVGVLTAAFTSTPETAQFTTAPYFFAGMAGVFWVTTTPAAEVTAWQLAVPGGSVADLVRWAMSDARPEHPLWWPIAAAVAWTAAAWALGLRHFRWASR